MPGEQHDAEHQAKARIAHRRRGLRLGRYADRKARSDLVGLLPLLRDEASSAMTFTTAEKLAVVEHLIEDFRWARKDPAVPEHHTHAVLCAIAVDLRARLPDSAGEDLAALERRLDAVTASKTALGYANGAM